MRLVWCSALLLGAIVLLRGDCSGASPHSARYFFTVVSEPGQGLPQFIAVAYMNGQPIGDYDSSGGKIVSRVPWVRKTEKEDPQLWDMHTQCVWNQQLYLGGHLDTVQKRYNQSGGFHTMQFMVGCELSKDGRKGGFAQYGYDGGNFIAFDKETLTWTAADVSAQIIKRKWDQNEPRSRRWKAFLEETCIKWLRKYLDYGKETLLRKEPPTAKVTRSRASHEGLETLLCRAHGFYPKEIDVTWRKDGEVREEDTSRGVLSPNSDGTYYTWLSIDIDPKDRKRFWCHVEHDGLLEPLDVAVEESASVPVWLLAVGVVLGVVVAVLLVAGIVLYTKKRQEKAPTGQHQPVTRGPTAPPEHDVLLVGEKQVKGTLQSQAV